MMSGTASLAESLASLPEAERAKILADLTEAEAAALEWDWKFWARPKQLAPAGNWLAWLILAGRGFGKTRTGAEWVRASVCGSTPLAPGRYKQVALIAETAADAREVMVGDGKMPGEGSGLLQVHPKDFRPIYEPPKRRLTWPNGAIATLYNAVEPEQLRGPQHDAAWCDELAKWRYGQDTWDQLQFGLRLGEHPRVVVTTTPKPTRLLRSIMEAPGTVVTRGSTYDNRGNLAAPFLAEIERRYAGTRLGRQEIDAEILDDVAGALWSRGNLDAYRVRGVSDLVRVVIAIDPAVSNEEGSDETGLIAAGVGSDGRGYVFEDRSGKYAPDAWAREAVAMYHRWQADRIVAEVNQGGDLVEATIRTVDAMVPYRAVRASRGKAVRAEPIAALYEQGRISHVGSLPALEDQMCQFTADFDRKAMGFSPDRLDALVWAMTDLMISGSASLAVGTL